MFFTQFLLFKTQFYKKFLFLIFPITIAYPSMSLIFFKINYTVIDIKSRSDIEKGSASMLVKNIMTRTDASLTPEQSVTEAWELIQKLNVTGLPVLDENGNVIGQLTKDDIFNAGPEVLRRPTPVKSIMRTEVFILTEEDPLVDAWSLSEQFFPVVDRQGQLVGVLDKTKVGFALFQAANRMLTQVETILDSAHNGIIAIDSNGIVTIFNQAAEKITRRPKSQALGRHLSEVIIPLGLLDILKNGKSQKQHKFTIHYSSGSHTYLTNRSPIIENGQVVGAVGVFQDISEIEFISEELNSVKQLNNELQCIIESSYDGILIADREGTIIKANAAHERITGIPSSEIQGKKMSELVEKSIYSKSIVEEVIEKGEPVTLVEKTPSQNHLLITGNPVYNQEGEIVRVVVNIRDLTELNQLREELEQSRELSLRYHNELTQLRSKLLKQEGLVFNSPKMRELIEVALRVAQVDSTVLILGESGVGKEVIAKMIHNHSKRRGEPFITVNCAAIPETLLESELFGYERGAFTGANREGKAGMFELAHNGTLFLDEIGDLPLAFQVKLLRVIQEREVFRIGGSKPRPVNVRILAATNQDLELLVKEGKFREDLYFRLNVVPLYVWPLRERREDIIPLTYTFLQKFNNEYKINKEFAPEVFDAFLNYHWPGNVRELENLVERLMVTTPGETITLRDLPSYITAYHENQTPEVSVKGVLPLKKARMELERQLIRNALEKFGSTYKAARALKVDQSTIVRKINRLKSNGLAI